MKKRFLPVLLTLGLTLILAAAVTASAADIVDSGACGDNVTWTLDSEGVLTISGTGDMKDYSVGSTPWYSYRDNILSVIITDRVTNIGNFAFYYCKNLTSAMIADNVTIIGDYAFSNCDSLTSIIIPDNATSIGSQAFHSCDSLTSVTIPDGVTNIGYFAFASCYELTSVTIGSGVTNIGNYAFGWCTSLTDVSVDKNNSSYTSVDGILFNKGRNILVQYPARKDEISYVIPDSVTSIGPGAFSACYNLTSVTIPDSVTSIEDGAFSNCTSLVSITISDSVTSIGSNTFSFCTSLTEITISDSVTSIGNNAFSSCYSLTSITIPASVTSIERDAFFCCTRLSNITIPASVTSIGSNAFGCCRNLTSISVDADSPNYTSVGGVLFNKECDTLVQYPAGKDEISYVIPKSVTSISDCAFWGCSSLTSVTILGNITAIDVGTFCGCTNLTEIAISNSIVRIGYYAFYDCPNLTDVYYASSEDDWEEISIDSSNISLASATIHDNSFGTLSISPPYAKTCSVALKKKVNSISLYVTELNSLETDPVMCAYLAEYDDDGRLTGLSALPCQVTEDGFLFSGEVPETAYKLFLLDGDWRPVTEAYVGK